MNTIDTTPHANRSTTAGSDMDRMEDFQQALLVLARTGDGTAALASIAAARQGVQAALDALKCRVNEGEAGE